MGDSEITLSAMSGEEQRGGSEQHGETNKTKKSASSLTQGRRKKRLHSNSSKSRGSGKGGDSGRMSGGAPGPSCTSERVSQEVAMKATQARRLLAKVRGGTLSENTSCAYTM